MKKHKLLLSTALLTAGLAFGVPAHAQYAQTPTTFVELSKPSSDVIPHPAYIKTLARSAYVWGWPMVNMINRHDQITKAPKPGLLGGILPVAPQGQIGMLHDYIEPSETFVTCPNQDVVYGLGFFDLDTQPVVIQVPDFGDRFWVYALYDARTDQFGELGKPYDSKPGFYLLAGPNWEGDVPDGITDVIRSSTALANTIPRVFMDDTDEDRAAVQKVIDQIVVYPLSDFDGDMKTIDWSDVDNIPAPAPAAGESGGETKWVIPERFFDQLGQVLQNVPPLPGEEAMYEQFRWLLELAAKNPEIKKLIDAEAVSAEEEMVKPFFAWEHNGKPAGNGWNRSVNNADWGVDYYNRMGTSKSNMFDNRPNETQYFYTDYDQNREQLDGSKTYAITFAEGQEPPVDGFWSLTLYNDKHLFHANDLNRFSLGTKNKKLTRNDDGSLTVYAGGTSPGGDKENNWLPAPDGTFSLYIRAYWGQKAILDGSWQPPKIEVMQ